MYVSNQNAIMLDGCMNNNVRRCSEIKLQRIEEVVNQNRDSKFDDCKGVQEWYNKQSLLCQTSCFDYKEPNFFQQKEILLDLVDQKMLTWPSLELNENLCNRILKEFKFPAPQKGICTEYDKTRPQKDPKMGLDIWLQFHLYYLIGVFVPLISLLFKLLAPPAVRRYYAQEGRKESTTRSSK